MKKKVYSQPHVETMALTPMTIICVSMTPGAPVTPPNPGDPPAYGD